MIWRQNWSSQVIASVLALMIACISQQTLAGNNMRPDLNTPDRPIRKPPPLVLSRRILIENLRQHIGNTGKNMAPGIAVGLVTEHGDLTLGLGERDTANHLGVESETMFGIGSVSKLFIGMALAKAVSDGDLKYTTKANDLLDASLQIDNRITLGQLVTHRSGLPNFPQNLSSRSNSPNDRSLEKVMPAKDYSKANLSSCLKQNECHPNSTPGTHYGYSNLGIGLLSIALQNRFGYQDSNELIRKLITEKLSMERTSTNEPNFIDKYRVNLAQGYRYEESSSKLVSIPLSDMGILAGSGELISTANDMNHFLKALTGLESGVLKSAAEEMNRPLESTNRDDVKISYAHQIKRSPDGVDIHWKSGVTAGYTAIVLWQTKPKIGLVLLANRGKMKSLESTGKRLISLISHQIY